MAAPSSQEISNWMGRRVNGSDGAKVGKIDDIYLDDATGQPEWMAVTTGWFGTRVSFVPLSTARFEGDDVVIPYDKDTVKASPHAERDGHLSPEEERRLYEHYGIEYSDETTELAGGVGGTSPATEDVTTPSGESEVAATARPSGQVRMRKWIDTEEVTGTVPTGTAPTGTEAASAEPGRAVSNEGVVPGERVRLEKETVVEEETRS